MPQEKPNPPLPDWEKVAWQQTPYRGVFIHEVEEVQNPNNPSIPLYTVMALKIKSGAEIPLHRHNRELSWTEVITLPNGGWLETKRDRKGRKIKTKNPFTIVIKSGEFFGLKNIHPSKPLYFYSRMEPGFTGYEEIEEVKTK